MKERVKTCRDCVHYLEHYIKHAAEFVNICQGHCTEKKGNKFRKADKLCECFEERDRARERRGSVQSIAESLSRISDCIQGMREVLKPEELYSEDFE